jgi:serine/threonine-protein kinase
MVLKMKSRNYNGGTLYDSRREQLRYQLADTLGTGSSGTVYRSQHPDVADVPIAVKVCNFGEENEQSPEYTAFKKEAELSYELQHEHLVSTYRHWLGAIAVPASSILDWRQVMTMEYADGGSLRDQLAKRGRFPVGKVVATIEQTARGVGYLHAQGLIHGDIKPGNLLQFGEVIKVGDFGVTEKIEQLKGGRFIMGSPAYMAPEQFKGQSPAPHSDLYSTGITAYELATGTRPFNSYVLKDYMQQHVTPTPAPSFAEIKSVKLTPQLEAIEPVIAQSIANDPNARHENVAAFSEDLRKAYEEGVARAARDVTIVDLAPYPTTPIDKPHSIDVATQFFNSIDMHCVG